MGSLKSVFVSLLAVGVLGLGAVTVEAKEVMKVSGSAAVMKQTPSPSAPTLLTLKKGDFVVADSVTNDWALVDFQGEKGAIAQNVLAKNLPYTIKISGSKGGIVIKEKPTTTSATSAMLKHGMVIEDYGTAENGYSFVRYGNIIGYAQTSFMAVPKATVKYTNKDVSLRRIASPSAETVGSVKNNSKVEVYANIVGWSYIKVNNISGYVPTEDLVDKAAAATPVTKPVSKPSTPVKGDASSGYYVILGAPTHFKNCKAMNAYYPNGVHKSHPAYATPRDRDNDGWACEKN